MIQTGKESGPSDLTALVLGKEYPTSIWGLMDGLQAISERTEGRAFVSQIEIPAEDWSNLFAYLKTQDYVVLRVEDLTLESTGLVGGRDVVVVGYRYNNNNEEEKNTQSMLYAMTQKARRLFILSEDMVPFETFHARFPLERSALTPRECWSMELDPKTDTLNVVCHGLVERNSVEGYERQGKPVQQQERDGITRYSYVKDRYPVPMPALS
jgi:hypothetical protein